MTRQPCPPGDPIDAIQLTGNLPNLLMRAPDASVRAVPFHLVPFFLSKGATVIQELS